MKPTFSVITPSFNQGRFLAAAMESVLSQEGDFFLDYIILDGGSTDESLEVIGRYDRMVASGAFGGRCRGIRLRWLSEPDNGQADALVKGFGMATGDVFAWLNSDDTYLPGALQAVSRLLSADEEYGCVYGKGMYTAADGEPVAEYPTQPFDPVFLAIRNFICQPAAFFRRPAYESCGGIDTSLRFAMDYDLWIRMGASTRFFYLPTMLATYRLHDESKTVDPATSVANHAEVLATLRRHFGWTPLNRVYGYCFARARRSLPAFLSRIAAVRIALSLCWAVFEYLRLNRVPRRADLMVLNLQSLRLLVSAWEGVPSTKTRSKEQKTT